MAVEARRGCGHRKVGGIYLVADGISAPCHRLPFPLGVCLCCGAGIKQSRGWTWVTPKSLLGDCEQCNSVPPGAFGGQQFGFGREHAFTCPICTPSLFAFERERKEGDRVIVETDERAGMIWVGERFYPSPRHFEEESRTHGISRRIKAVPRGFVVGKTRVLLAHPKACVISDENGDRLGPGIFAMFTPQRIEKIVTDKTPPEELEKLREQGITPVVVPHDDKDHQGTVYDKDDDEDEDLKAKKVA